jgi:hypothetical protein
MHRLPVSPAGTRRAWREWSEVAELFSGPADRAWAVDRSRVDAELRDPWTPE